MAAWAELSLMTLLTTTAPAGGPQLDEPHEDPETDPLPQAIHAGAPNTGPRERPMMRAVDGFILVSYLDGPPRRFYVARDPDFIARKLQDAIDSGRAMYEYWDKPGYVEAKKIRIPCRLVTEIEVEHREADLDALYLHDPATSYVAPVGTEPARTWHQGHASNRLTAHAPAP
jgi:hypothetical protein